MAIRTRFAPSPTGFFHIGSARTALFNWLYARHTGGTFVLRIEDTDKERNTDEALKVLLEGMRWLGMDWDEGPEVGGPYGPYFQSQRTDLYRAQLKVLADRGRAYEKDGAWWFRLEGERHTAFDDFAKKEIEKVAATPVVIQDLVRGRVERAEDRDFVLFRANGEPVFHFVNVVDDIAMGITHVIRGEDHLSNTSKHVELFNAFGAPLPVYAHIPLILKTDGPGKMSKRDRGALVEEYRDRGYLAEAVRNYLCLLGWTPTDGREVLPIQDIIAQFELSAIHQANARFDERKMASVNQTTLRALPLEAFAKLASARLAAVGVKADPATLAPILSIVQEKLSELEHLPAFVSYFLTEEFVRNPEALSKLKGDPKSSVRQVLAHLESAAWDNPGIDAAFTAAGAEHGQKPTPFFAPTRYAVSGQAGGPHLTDVLRVLGRERTLNRLRLFAAGS